jgi:hypothetical protein
LEIVNLWREELIKFSSLELTPAYSWTWIQNKGIT